MPALLHSTPQIAKKREPTLVTQPVESGPGLLLPHRALFSRSPRVAARVSGAEALPAWGQWGQWSAAPLS